MLRRLGIFKFFVEFLPPAPLSPNTSYGII